jgi:hypothetical protein
MDRFGVQRPRLKAIARTPELPGPVSRPNAIAGPASRAPVIHHWQGARVRDLTGEEYSAFGVSRESGGVRVVEGKVGEIQTGDLIQGVGELPVRNLAELLQRQNAAAGVPLVIGIVRGQRPQEVRLEAYTFVGGETGEPQGGVPLRALTTRPATTNEPVASLSDGRLGKTYGPVFPNGVVGGAYKADLGGPVNVARITSWSFNQNGNRGPQRFAVFGSNAERDPGWDPATLVPIAEVDTTGQSAGQSLATSVQRAGGGPLGVFRWLVWVTEPVTSAGENTAFQEFEVQAAR